MDRSRGVWALALALAFTGCAGADRRLASVPPGLRAPAAPPRARAGLFARRPAAARPVMTSISPTVARFFPGLAAPARGADEPGGPVGAGVGDRPASPRLARRSEPAPSPARATSAGEGLAGRSAQGWLAFRPESAPAPGRGPAEPRNAEPLLPVALRVEVAPRPLDPAETRLVSHEALLPPEPHARDRGDSADADALPPIVETPTVATTPETDALPPVVEVQPVAVTTPAPTPAPATARASRPAPSGRPVSPAVAMGSDAPPIPGGFGAMQLFPNSYYERAPAPASVALPPPAPRVWRPWKEWARLPGGGGGGQVAEGG